MPPYLQSMIDTAFYAAITGGLAFLVNCISKLVSNVAELNSKIGIVIEKMADHDYRIQRLEKKQDKEF